MGSGVEGCRRLPPKGMGCSEGKPLVCRVMFHVERRCGAALGAAVTESLFHVEHRVIG